MKESEFNEIVIWRCALRDTRQEIEDYAQLLTRSELERAHQFIFPLDRKKYILTRAFLRLLLGDLLTIDPRLVEIKHNRFGKPFIKSNELYFNLSYVDSTVYIAATRLCEIGIDVETVSGSGENNELFHYLFPMHTDTATPQKDFGVLWTQTEAFLKAQGVGFQENNIPYARLDPKIPYETWKDTLYTFSPEPHVIGSIALIKPYTPKVSVIEYRPQLMTTNG